MVQGRTPITPHIAQMFLHGANGGKIYEAREVWMGMRATPDPQVNDLRVMYAAPEGHPSATDNGYRFYDVRCSYKTVPTSPSGGVGTVTINQVGKGLYAPGILQESRNNAVYNDGYDSVDRNRVESLFMKFADAYERWEVASGHGWTRAEQDKRMAVAALQQLLDDTARLLQKAVDILASAENAQDKADVDAMEYIGQATVQLVWEYRDTTHRCEFVKQWVDLSPVQQEVYDANMGKVREALTKLLTLPLAA